MSFESWTNHESWHHLPKNVLLTWALFLALWGFSSCTNNTSYQSREPLEECIEKPEWKNNLDMFSIDKKWDLFFWDFKINDWNCIKNKIDSIMFYNGNYYYITNKKWGSWGSNPLSEEPNIIRVRQIYKNDYVYHKGKSYFWKFERNGEVERWQATEEIPKEKKDWKTVVNSWDEYLREDGSRVRKEESEKYKEKKEEEYKKRKKTYFIQPQKQEGYNPKNDSVSFTEPSTYYSWDGTYYDWNNWKDWQDNIVWDNEQQ